jgi:O-antigen/teichoic acid export membrane protein
LTTAPTTSTSASDASLGSAVRLGAEIVVRLSSIVATLWLTRSLGVSTFGTFILALSLGLMIAELCDLGLNAIVVPLIVRSRANFRTLFLMKAVMTGAVGLVAALLIPAAAHYSGVGTSLLVLTTIHFIGASWIDMTGTTLRALGRRKAEALLLFVFRFTLVGLVIGAPFGISLWGASLAYALAIGPALATGWWLLRRPIEAATSAGATAASILRQAAPMGVNGYLAIVSTRVELFLLQPFGGEHVVGLFGGALRIVESLLTLPSAIAAGALPSVARDVVTGSTGAAQRTFGLVVWLAVPAAIGLALCAPQVLYVLGPGFVEGTMALRLLSIALFLCFSNAALIHVLIAAGDTSVIPKLTALRVGVAIVAGVLLIPRLAAPGAAISFSIAELVLFGTLVVRTRSHAAIEVHRPVLWALAASLPMVAVLESWTLSLPLSILTGALSFGIATAAILRRGTAASGLA